MIDIIKLYIRPNSSEYIVFISPGDDLEDLSMYQHIFIRYRNEKTQESFHIACAWFSTDSKRFYQKLKMAIDNQLQLDSSIQNDIGYEYEQLYYAFAHDVSIDIDAWVGRKYKAIDTDGDDLQSGPLWIYNDAQGNIVLEITPPCATMFFEAYPEEEPISFDEWMKDYKPLLVTTISKETAQQWVKQIDDLIKTISEKMEKIKHEKN